MVDGGHGKPSHFLHNVWTTAEPRIFSANHINPIDSTAICQVTSEAFSYLVIDFATFVSYVNIWLEKLQRSTKTIQYGCHGCSWSILSMLLARVSILINLTYFLRVRPSNILNWRHMILETDVVNTACVTIDIQASISLLSSPPASWSSSPSILYRLAARGPCISLSILLRVTTLDVFLAPRDS